MIDTSRLLTRMKCHVLVWNRLVKWIWETMFPAVEEVVEVPGDAPVEEEAHETPRPKLSVFRRQHINLGHPPTTLLTKILRDARATYLQMLLSNTVVLGTESYRLDGMAFQPLAQAMVRRAMRARSRTVVEFGERYSTSPPTETSKDRVC